MRGIYAYIAASQFRASDAMIFTKESDYVLIDVIMSVTLFVNIIEYMYVHRVRYELGVPYWKKKKKTVTNRTSTDDMQVSRRITNQNLSHYL